MCLHALRGCNPPLWPIPLCQRAMRRTVRKGSLDGWGAVRDSADVLLGYGRKDQPRVINQRQTRSRNRRFRALRGALPLTDTARNDFEGASARQGANPQRAPYRDLNGPRGPGQTAMAMAGANTTSSLMMTWAHGRRRIAW